jgi:hypothetical protein
MENKTLGWCVKCKKKTEIKNPEVVEIKNSRGSRNAIKGTCSVCGTKMNVFIRK